MDLMQYRSVASGESLSAYTRTSNRKVGAIDFPKSSLPELWELHDRLTTTDVTFRDGPSLLDLKIEIAGRVIENCTLCERRCGANRTVGESGFCGVTDSFYFLEKILWGEERPLVPSHEIFFSGCNMRCRFCYSYESLSNTSLGTQAVPVKLAEIISNRRKEGAINVNLIGGEPTVHLPVILKMLRELDSPTAVVWNSNFYMSEESMKLLDGVVDLYVGDFRFGNDRCGEEIGGTQRYCETASRNFLLAAKSGDVIVRHLLLPGHTECCLKPVAKWMAKNLPETPFNLMFQYTPFHQALDDPGLCRMLNREEEKAALEIASSFGLNTSQWNVPVDEASSVDFKSKDGIETIITIRPDGKVGIMHLHAELLELVQALELGGSIDG